VIWVTAICCVGFFFGSNWQRLVQLVKDFDSIVQAVAGLALVAGVIAYYLRKRKAGASS
jgi:LPXTG-motif cell wall-anchored protein